MILIPVTMLLNCLSVPALTHANKEPARLPSGQSTEARLKPSSVPAHWQYNRSVFCAPTPCSYSPKMSFGVFIPTAQVLHAFSPATTSLGDRHSAHSRKTPGQTFHVMAACLHCNLLKWGLIRTPQAWTSLHSAMAHSIM